MSREGSAGKVSEPVAPYGRFVVTRTQYTPHSTLHDDDTGPRRRVDPLAAHTAIAASGTGSRARHSSSAPFVYYGNERSGIDCRTRPAAFAAGNLAVSHIGALLQCLFHVNGLSGLRLKLFEAVQSARSFASAEVTLCTSDSIVVGPTAMKALPFCAVLERAVTWPCSVSAINDLWDALQRETSLRRTFDRMMVEMMALCQQVIRATHTGVACGALKLDDVLIREHQDATYGAAAIPLDFIYSTFVGICDEVSVCCSCNAATTRRGAGFVCVSLAVPLRPSSQPFQFAELISQWQSRESLEMHQVCSACGATSTTQRVSRTLRRWPHVLVVFLDRYSEESSGFKHVDIPAVLDLAETKQEACSSGEGLTRRFWLQAAVCYKPNTYGDSKYSAFVRSAASSIDSSQLSFSIPDSVWYWCCDSGIREVAETEVIKQQIAPRADRTREVAACGEAEMLVYVDSYAQKLTFARQAKV